MIVRRFLLWAREASASDRAEGVRALARAYLQSPLSDDERREAETALMVMSDDASPLVRLALAEELAGSNKAPRAIINALIRDQSHIAALLLAYSPLLTDPDLIDAAALGDGLMQRAIAQRPFLSVGVTAAIAEVGETEALIALVENHLATMTATILRRIVERAGEVPALREAIIARPDCPPDVLNLLAGHVSATLGAFARECGWISDQRMLRLTREAGETVAIDLADQADSAGLMAIIGDLKSQGRLTAAVLIRALVLAKPAIVEGALSSLADMPLDHVSAAVHDRHGAGFRAIYRKAGLPEGLYPAFAAALEILSAGGDVSDARHRAALSRAMIGRVTEIYAGKDTPEAGGLLVLMRRMETEVLREEARIAAETLADEAALALLIEHAPEFLIEAYPERRAA
jgi:uncharacterized protein (DUF2336 family)